MVASSFFIAYVNLSSVFYRFFCCNRKIIFIVYWLSMFKDILGSNVYCAVAPFKRVGDMELSQCILVFQRCEDWEPVNNSGKVKQTRFSIIE